MKISNEKLLKICDFYKKYKLFIGLGVVSALLFACPFVDKMWVAVSVILGLFMLTCKIDEIFAVMLFMMPFSGLDSLYVITIIIAMVVLLIKYIIDIISKKKQVFWFPLAITLAIILLSTIKSFLVGSRHIETGMLLVFVFALCYFAFVYKNDIKVAKCFNALLAGLAVSAGITLVLLRFEEFKFFIYAYEGYYMRLKMTTFHMNNLALLCIFEFAYSIHSILNKSRKIWIDLVSIVFVMTLGVLTVSKVFLVMIAFFVLYFIVALVVKLKKKSIKYLVIFAGLVVVLCIVGKSYILNIYDRMFLYHKGGSALNEILNGRVDIWKQYIADFKSCWHNLLFGVGLFRPNFDFDPHNAYIFVLHRFGVVGVTLILVLVFAYIMSAKPKFKFSFCRILLLLSWFVVGLEENVLSDQFAIFLIFGLMLFFGVKKEKQESESFKNNQGIDEKLQDKNSEKKEEKTKRKLRVKFNQLSNK